MGSAFPPRSTYFWGALFVLWYSVLWFLSDRAIAGPKLETDLPIDKVLHFGYFFGGAGLLSAALRLSPLKWHWSTLHLVVILVLFAVGVTDEWHQSWNPKRTGNDIFDLTADVLGALTGTLVFRKVFPKVFVETTS